MPHTVRNWLGNVASTVETLARPSTIEELQRVVGEARGPLLVLGARMSKTEVLHARGGIALDTTALNGIVEMGPDEVVVQAGITLYDLSKALYAQGRQLPGFTITANPTIGGSITAPTKGSNHPFNARANGVSAAVRALTLVPPSGELVELSAGTHDDELALVKDSYGAAGVVVQARLATVPLVSAEVHDEVLPLRRFLQDRDDQARGLEERTLVFPKLGCVLLRVHEDRKRVEPELPFEQLVTGPNTPYVRLVRRLPRLGRAGVLSTAVRLGAERRRRRKLHIENLTIYPTDGTAYLDFITWSMPLASFDANLPRVVRFCRAHPAYPAESLIEIFRLFPEVRFFDGDERVAIDPVAFDPRERPRWEVFYRDYNRLMLDLGASPFLNQTRYLDANDLRRVYGSRYQAWKDALLALDPSRKLGSVYLDRLLGLVP